MSCWILEYLTLLNFFFTFSHCIVSNDNKPFPIYFDWRDKGAISPVKDQGVCEACWAFSAVACIESHLKIYLHIEEILSEQFLIDCDPRKIGCNSTSVLKAYGDIVSGLGGVLRNSDYKPYEAKQGSCSWDLLKRPIPVVGYRRVEPNEETMSKYIYAVGPLSAAINSASMRTYQLGIDEPTDELCPPQQTDHAVLIVGFNTYVDPKTQKLLNYWIIKNSWGENWGDRGFYYLVRGRNACGIATDVSYPFVM